jgi:hypothetical protein
VADHLSGIMSDPNLIARLLMERAAQPPQNVGPGLPQMPPMPQSSPGEIRNIQRPNDMVAAQIGSELPIPAFLAGGAGRRLLAHVLMGAGLGGGAGAIGSGVAGGSPMEGALYGGGGGAMAGLGLGMMRRPPGGIPPGPGGMPPPVGPSAGPSAAGRLTDPEMAAIRGPAPLAPAPPPRAPLTERMQQGRAIIDEGGDPQLSKLLPP